MARLENIYQLGLFAHAIRNALLEALEVLGNVSLLLQKHLEIWKRPQASVLCLAEKYGLWRREDEKKRP